MKEKKGSPSGSLRLGTNDTERRLSKLVARLADLETTIVGHLSSEAAPDRSDCERFHAEALARIENQNSALVRLQMTLEAGLQALENPGRSMQREPRAATASSGRAFRPLLPTRSVVSFLSRFPLFRRLHRAVLLQTARHAARRGDWTRAASRYRLLLAIKPDLPAIRVQYGHALKESGKAEDALWAYRDALALDPRLPDLQRHIDVLEQAIRRGGNDVPQLRQTPVTGVLVSLEEFEKSVRDAGHRPVRSQQGRRLWLDLTTSLNWSGGVVGIVRAELEIACALKKIDPNVRFSIEAGSGFAEVEAQEIQWLLDAPNVADAYMKFFARYKDMAPSGNTIRVKLPEGNRFFHPFEDQDILLSAGWMDSKKEIYLASLKKKLPNIIVCYLVYDIITIHRDTAHFYTRDGQEKFSAYIKWISNNADFVFYGGETARIDTTALQIAENWPSPPSTSVKFGTDIVKSVDRTNDANLLEKLGITGKFILTVGSLEPRKNHDTLYRAYLLALEEQGDKLPQLVICGRPLWRVEDLMDSLRRDPRVQGRILQITPTDSELAALYANCAFTLMSSLYEGWNLTLPESLGQGKFCLTAETPALREIGRDLVDYVPPFDARSWADKIIFYATDEAALRARERRIVAEWQTLTWLDTARSIYETAQDIAQKTLGRTQRRQQKEPTVWMDLTQMLFLPAHLQSDAAQIEFLYAYYLHKIKPGTRYFAFIDGYATAIEPDLLRRLFDTPDPLSAYDWFRNARQEGDIAAGGRHPFHVLGTPLSLPPSPMAQFPDNSILLFTGMDGSASNKALRSDPVMTLLSGTGDTLTCQIIYDLGPLLLPHFAPPETCQEYATQMEFVCRTFDHIIYASCSTQKDGMTLSATRDWPSPSHSVIELGSESATSYLSLSAPSGSRSRKLLAACGITGEFVLAVGAIEPCQNYDMLYKAYLKILESYNWAAPIQLVFAGQPGWRTDDFMAIATSDDRIKGKIIILTPSDEQLDALYRHCRFTLLPRFYSGWSACLSASLSYGKFCLASDIAAFRDAGRDFAEYINPLDTFAWAERIEYYVSHASEVEAKETQIRQKWEPLSWRESAEHLIDSLHEAHRAKFFQPSPARAGVEQ